jgi:hypothetical protein
MIVPQLAKKYPVVYGRPRNFTQIYTYPEPVQSTNSSTPILIPFSYPHPALTFPHHISPPLPYVPRTPHPFFFI